MRIKINNVDRVHHHYRLMYQTKCTMSCKIIVQMLLVTFVLNQNVGMKTPKSDIDLTTSD